mgnify:CR=1 FL=1
MTRVAGVAGRPIGHSLSPAIHGAWITAAGLDAVYHAFGPEDAAAFDRLLDRGRAGELRGLNVTAPYKEQALARATDSSATARRCGSANLLLFEDGRIRADSTDGLGLMAALAEQAPGLALAGRFVVVLGAGGAQLSLATTASQMGGNVRVGLEDSLFISRGKLAESNAQQVQKIRRIVEDLGCEIASPDEAREILGLKGADRTAF